MLPGEAPFTLEALGPEFREKRSWISYWQTLLKPSMRRSMLTFVASNCQRHLGHAGRKIYESVVQPVCPLLCAFM